MGAPEGMKPQLIAKLRSSVIVLCLFLGSSSCVNGLNYTYYYDSTEVAALQTIWGAWKTNTPDPTSNLAGWSSTQTKFCEYLDPDSNATEVPTWRGVQCTFYCNFTGSEKYLDPNCTIRQAYLIGISIANASIEGVLPPDIGNFSSLYTLELTGNPNLTGPLPETLGDTWLNILDVHDNGFTGPIPDLYWLWNVLLLDLSGNHFSGGYPFSQLRTMQYLQELSIGDNNMTGEIPFDAYTNKTELEKLDISDNGFNGSLPDLNPMRKLRHLDVSGNQFEGPLPDLRVFEALRYVNLGRNRFTGTANLQNILNLTGTSLTLVNLSHNNLTGDLPSWDASSLGSIQELYLDNNKLSGTLNISEMSNLNLLQSEDDKSTENLGIMSLSNNSITNVIFDANDIEKISTVFILNGNPYCENYDSNDDGQRCYCSQICFVSPAKANSRRIIIISATTSVIAVILILLVVVGLLLLKSRRYKRYLQLQFEQKFEEFDVKPTIFSYNELRIATRDFSEDMKLGQGGYGAVYKGVLPNGNVVAVKQLYVKTAQGMDDFLNEVVLITGMKHRNLVNLKGCCLREHQRLLVYEYVDNYDVDHVLTGSKREELSWPMRLKICLGVARGLHYLHALAHPRVIHRDIKAGNVLLDSNMEPKIADFGLALLFPDEQSHIMTVHVAGTKGYLAPEYASLGQLSDKVDVYSFGVLCLEIISGRKNIDETAPIEQIYLSKWAWLLHEQDRLMELIDPELQLTTDEEVRDVQRVINVCLLCIQNSAEKRPSMARVVSILQSDTESEVIVLGEGKLSGRRSLNSTRSNRSVDMKTGLGSVSEEGSSSNGFYGTSSNGSSHGRGRRGLGESGVDSFAVELSNITAR
ncbi:hypothetical protein M758_3G218500 [Ceratodon purpureus]|nr:hypothetical protein M758_3G218500 [Ceratodon purpureus]KAG0624026.1 hypothetical protein M758_3G218500 [Ceratodon purpureus]KAG0624027.1 hypothetical protein M758_3G218500 [Ceratodon purpureus]KAG0624028.1 hypothetical protein M758_3G218500 [Ceratodon purpureus]KAG0624029.1 hypothetical protein M758_3G218500 [Ceratodon purpureus]